MKRITFIRQVLVLTVIMAFQVNANATKHRVSVANFKFTPDTINVLWGDTIRWYWVNGMHTTTSVDVPPGATSWDAPIDVNDTIFEYVPNKTGTYHYHCTFHYTQGMVGTIFVAVDRISEIPSSPGFTIYPNPFVDNLTFRVESKDLNIIDLKVYDITGKIIRQVTFVTSPYSQERTINLSDLPQGLLFFQFLDNANNVYTRRVIHNG